MECVINDVFADDETFNINRRILKYISEMDCNKSQYNKNISTVYKSKSAFCDVISSRRGSDTNVG